MVFAKAILILIQSIVFLKKIFESSKHHFFKNSVKYSRVGQYLKNQLAIIVIKDIAITDNIAINEIEKMTIFFKYN